MPKHYTAICNYVPIDDHAHLDRIEIYFNSKHRKLVELFESWKLRELEYDDCQTLVDQPKRRLTGFALDCNAMPLRPPRQLIATTKAIARKPQAFLEDPGKYDPEVAARVYDAIASVSRENQLLLADFECGRGQPPPAEKVVIGARKVLNDLQTMAEEKSYRGGQTLVLQRELAVDLRRIFERFGGRSVRITRFDANSQPLPVYRECGPFHDFLRLVLPPALLFAKMAGSKMESVRSMFTMSEGGNTPTTKLSEFPLRTAKGTEKPLSRMGNFLALHGHRFKPRR